MDGMEGLGWLFFGGLRAAAAAVLRKRRDKQAKKPRQPVFSSLFLAFVEETKQKQRERREAVSWVDELVG